MALFENSNYDFIKWRWHAIAFSAVIIIAGFVYGIQRGIPLGIDFSGGTILVVKFEQPVSDDQVRQALGTHRRRAGHPGVRRSGREPEADPAAASRGRRGRGPRPERARRGRWADQGQLGKFEVISQELVGPVIGADLQRKGIYATLASIIGITIYIGLRFRFAFAIGAIAATLHDVLVTVAFLFFFGYDLSLNIVAAILTITGYSVNDTIVIFDRVRENLRSKRRDSLEKVVNESVNQTLSRTIITAGTTFLAVLSLYLFGGEVLEGFAFTMLVGIISGTYSTIFIAASIAILLGNKQAKGRPASARKVS